MKSEILFSVIRFSVFYCFCVLSSKADDCSDNEMGTIDNCFEINVFEKLQIPKDDTSQLLILLNTNPVLLCEAIQDLSDCIGQPLIQKCLNIQDFMKIFNDFDVARFFVTYYLLTKDFCDESNKFYLQSRALHESDIKQCSSQTGSSACEVVEKEVDCGAKLASNICGNKYGCFKKRYGRYLNCLIYNSCPYCNTLAVDKNPIKGVSCSDIPSPSYSTLSPSNSSFTFFSFFRIFFFTLFSFYSLLM